MKLQKSYTAMLISIIALSLFDVISTGIGVSSGHIAEGNPIASFMFGWSILGTCLIMAAITTGLTLLVFRYINRYRWVVYAMSVVLFAKIVVAYMHMTWIVMVI